MGHEIFRIASLAVLRFWIGESMNFRPLMAWLTNRSEVFQRPDE